MIKLLLAHGLDLYQSDVYLPEDNVTFASYASAYEHAIIRFSDLPNPKIIALFHEHGWNV